MRHRARDRVRPVAQDHDDPTRGVEFEDHVGSLVDGPDVVLGIDTHGVCELEAVIPFADLADVFPGLIEFEQPRVRASRIDEDVSL